MAETAVVLQGGGALGAYELGAARRLYEQPGFAPRIIAGVSIGAITATLLARPAAGRSPLEALEAFWTEVGVPGGWLPPPLRGYASMFGNAHFFTPRLDVFDMLKWTSLYDIAPLRATLTKLVDLQALADIAAKPQLLMTATDVAKGEIIPFDSHERSLTLDHVIASGSLPPSFPMQVIDTVAYWDGGLFDNTPLGAVLDAIGTPLPPDLTLYVVNLFPNAAPLPTNMMQVMERMLNLQFANRTAQDLELLARFDEVAALVQDLATQGHQITGDAFARVAHRNYVRIPRVVPITRPEQAGAFDGNDFSPQAIQARAEEGYACADRALA